MSVEPHAFGPFRLNPENGTLLRDGVLAPIGQKGALYRPGDSAVSLGEKAEAFAAAWRAIRRG